MRVVKCSAHARSACNHILVYNKPLFITIDWHFMFILDTSQLRVNVKHAIKTLINFVASLFILSQVQAEAEIDREGNCR